jgi:membrane fusion protein (multidrug efflux system)
VRSRSPVPGWLLLLACAACHPQHEESAAPAVPVVVRTATAELRELADAIEVTGTLEPPPGRSVKLGALVAGRIATVNVAEGDAVAAGQLLVSLEATPLRDAVDQADAALRQARALLVNASGRRERAEKLFAAGIAARQEVDDAGASEVAAESAVHNAEAGLSTAHNQLARSQLRAPFAGAVAHLYAAPGEPVDGSGKPIVEVADAHVLELRAAAAPAQLVRLAPGQRAELRVDGLGEQLIEGEVVAVAPVIDAATGVGTVRIRVDNRSGRLKGGGLASARVVLEVHRAAVAVPREALVPLEQGGAAAGGSGEGYAVELVQDGVARRRAITLGVTDRGYAEVRSGLTRGEVVVVQGAYALPDGTPVRAAGDVAGAKAEAPAKPASAPETGAKP